MNKKNNELKKLVKTVSRDWSLPTIEVWNKSFKDKMRQEIGWGFSEAVMINNKGLVSFYRLDDDQENYKFFILNKLKKDRNWLLTIYKKFKPKIKKLKLKTEQSLREISCLDKIPDDKIYKKFNAFIELFSAVLPVYLLFAWLWLWEEEGIFDNLENRKKVLDIMKKGRLISEGIYDPADRVILDIINIIANKYNIDKGLLKYATINEINNILSKHILPDNKELKLRKKQYILISDKIIIGKNPSIVLKNKKLFFREEKATSKINGQTAYPGKVEGKARIILTKDRVNLIKKGEILVTTMTTPDFIPAMKKAVAFITDEGGILCHAAIISREMKKPCIIGAKIATKVLKDGDLVEVDAEKGIVKILKRK